MMGDMDPEGLAEIDTTEGEFAKVGVFPGVSDAATADFRTKRMDETRGPALAGSGP